jgi:hypothetical protein
MMLHIQSELTGYSGFDLSLKFKLAVLHFRPNHRVERERLVGTPLTRGRYASVEIVYEIYNRPAQVGCVMPACRKG